MQLIPSLPKDLQPPAHLLCGHERLTHPEPKAPAIIGLLPKAHYSEQDEQRVIDRACSVVGGMPVPQPVVYGRNTQLGWVIGSQTSDKVIWVPDRKPLEKAVPLWATVNNYDDIIGACAAGRRLPMVWSKGHTTAPVANNWYDTYPVTGNPTAGTYTGTAFTAKAFDNTITGSLPIGSAQSPKTRHIVNQWGLATAGATQPIIWLYDRVVTYEACTFNAAASQNMTNGSTPPGARYSNGSLSGMQILVTCQTVFGVTQSRFTVLTYANQAQTIGQTVPTATTLTNIIVSAAAPTTALGARVVSPNLTAAGTTCAGPYMPLAVGDYGVTWIQNYTTSAANTGQMCMVLARPIMLLPLATANVVSQLDAVNMTANVEQIFDGACLCFLVYFPVATAATLMGGVDVAWN